MLPAVYPLWQKGVSQEPDSLPQALDCVAKLEGCTGRGLFVPSKGMMEGKTGGFHMCDGEQGAGRV